MLRHKFASPSNAVLLQRAFATAPSSIKEPLYNSMSDAFYEPRSSQQQNRSEPPQRLASPPPHTSLSEPEFLHNSMSDGLYEYRRSRMRLANSMTDPEYLQNSMSDAFYDIPKSRTGTAGIPRIRQGYSAGSAKHLPVMQRIVSRSSIHEPELLHNSFSHGEYPRSR